VEKKRNIAKKVDDILEEEKAANVFRIEKPAIDEANPGDDLKV